MVINPGIILSGYMVIMSTLRTKANGTSKLVILNKFVHTSIKLMIEHSNVEGTLLKEIQKHPPIMEIHLEIGTFGFILLTYH